MKYYRVYDIYSPQGQLYRLNDGVLEAQEGGEWVLSAWHIMWGFEALDRIMEYCDYWPDARLEEVECPVS